MKELSKILEIPVSCPPDFYKNPAYLESVKQAVETATSLVHSIDEDGRKKAKEDAAAIRKYVKTTNGFTKTVFDSLTGKVKEWRDQFTGETKKLEAAADGIISKFEALEAAKLQEIKNLVAVELKTLRDNAGVEEIFITRPDLKITLSGWITPAGNLTSKATGEIAAIVGSEISAQRQYRERQNILKIKCLENEINPPLSEDYFGGDFFHADDQVFEAKLEHLINIELERRKQLLLKQEAEKQVLIDKAEADKKQALELAERQKQQAVDEALREKQTEINKELFKNRLNSNDGTFNETPAAPTKPGTKKMRYTITFEATVKNNLSVEDFKTMIKNDVQCSGRALKAIVNEEVTEC